MGVFKRGYEAVAQEKERVEEEKKKRGSTLWRFFLAKDGEEADVSFLTEVPITFDEHSIKGFRNGKEFYDKITCCKENCTDCDDGNRPSFQGAYLIIDHREFKYKDNDGKEKTGKDQVRIYSAGSKILSQLERLSKRYGLSNRFINIVRLGQGTQTSYTFERGDERKYSKKEIENFLPENLREKYDGTVDSLYKIVEEQVALGFRKSPESKDEDDKDSEEYDNKMKDKLVSVDDEEDEEPKTSVKKTLGFKRSKPRENSVKNLFKRV